MAEYADDQFEWDEDKSDDCFSRRGFDFQFACRVFQSDLYYEEIDERAHGDEERNICVGVIEGRLFTVVYTLRHGRKRIISAWLSSDEEVRKYARFFGTG